MPKRPQPPDALLAGNVAVSLDAAGSPVATLSHPLGGACQVAVFGARVVSWRARDGLERLHGGDEAAAAEPVADQGSSAAAAPEDAGAVEASAAAPACGLRLRQLDCIPASAWTIETLQGGDGTEASPATFSVFAEVEPQPGGDDGPPRPPLAARATFSVLPGRLHIELEVANVAPEEDEVDAEGEVAGSAAPSGPPALPVDLGCCGLCGELAAASEAAAAAGGATAAPVEQAGGEGGAAELALRQLGLTVAADGFERVTVAPGGPGAPVHFEAVAAEAVVLQPGEAVSGSVTLEAL